jgi:phosphoribosylamine--glycine ligase
MNIFVIGSGGREHAICSTFSKSKRVSKIYCAQGNAGIAEIAECVPIAPDDVRALLVFASACDIDLTFVGGEASLALGIVDEFQSRGLRIVGPTKSAAHLESSKAFAKNFMVRHNIPTARYVTSVSTESAIRELDSGALGDASHPIVVKADGLAAGKGVVLAENRVKAIQAINEMSSLVGTAAADVIVLEECLVGREISLLAFCDGENFALMPPTRDHKRIGEGDTGPNTGGMGTITDDSLLSAEQTDEIIETVIAPTLRGCADEGFPFRGILFLGLMMTADGPRVLEYNVRFGDPETQSILVRLEPDLVDICEAMINGTLSDMEIRWKPGASATVVLAAEGYPGSPRKGDVINGLDEATKLDSVTVFHAGTSIGANNDLVTAGGRVLGVTAIGDNISHALERAYKATGLINWAGMQYRRDIGK